MRACRTVRPAGHPPDRRPTRSSSRRSRPPPASSTRATALERVGRVQHHAAPQRLRRAVDGPRPRQHRLRRRAPRTHARGRRLARGRSHPSWRTGWGCPGARRMLDAANGITEPTGGDAPRPLTVRIALEVQSLPGYDVEPELLTMTIPGASLTDCSWKTTQRAPVHDVPVLPDGRPARPRRAPMLILAQPNGAATATAARCPRSFKELREAPEPRTSRWRSAAASGGRRPPG